MRIKPLVLSLVLVLAAGAAFAGPAGSAQALTTKLKVTADQANLREKPDIGSSIVQAIPAGTMLEADRKDGEWYFVRYKLEDGGVIGGWIHESLVTVLEQGAAAGAPVAKPAAGTPAPAPSPRSARTGQTSGIKPPEFRTGSIPLEFAVSVGVAALSPSDLNDGTQGYVQWSAAAAGLTAPKQADLLHLAGMIGFELSYRFSPRLAFGIGADYMRGSNNDSIGLTGPVPETVSTKPSIRAVPVKLMVRYYPGAGFYLRGGLGIYAVKAGYFFRHENADASEQWQGSASTSGLGAEAAFGGEWGLGPRTILFVEAGLRMASFTGLTGKSRYRSSGIVSIDQSVNPNEDEAGLLFFFHKTAGEPAFPLIAVRAAIPSEEGVADARQARINISGTSLRVGVRYRF
jgi:opacity protein-like surface antigen